MAKKKKIEEELPIETGPKPRVHKLIIKNFRCIGSNPVEIELNNIVVLVGPNNVGKSSILRAYQLVMQDGSGESILDIDDFPNGVIDPNNLPEIELHSIVYDNSPGPKWIGKQLVGGIEVDMVKEKWLWNNPQTAPKRYGWIVAENRWAKDEDKPLMPWGAANIANSKRPEPHRVSPFDSPEEQASALIKILTAIIVERVKSMGDSEKGGDTAYLELVKGMKEIRKKVVEESKEEIEKVQNELGQLVSRIFPGYEVLFDAKPEDNVEKLVESVLIKSDANLRMGPKGALFKSTIDKQGSGARRTLLWTALKILSEINSNKKSSTKSHILLIDEPEICLHPDAIRQSCDLLYELPTLGNWQVMITTHSPAFIDISKDNTTIIRVDRGSDGAVVGTTLFRPNQASLDEDDKVRLKMMNIYDPYVAEFFFSSKNIIVEGDTEYAAFKHVISKNIKDYEKVHIIKARGKATIITLIKILNQFGAPYSILHDSDKPHLENGNTNSAWTLNINIFEATKLSKSKTRLIATKENFDISFLGKKLKSDKPYFAIEQLELDLKKFEQVKNLLNALLDFKLPVPSMAIEWDEISELEKFVNA